MKNKFIYIVSIFTILYSLSSCKKYLDINDSPNTAEKVDPKLLFSNAAVNYINLKSSGDLYIPMALAGQSIATGGNNPTGWGIPSEEQYVISSFSTGNTWRSLYTSVGANLKQAILLSERSTPKNNNAAAQCKVLLALVTYDLACIYGDVPFTEAWDIKVQYPKFDTQKQVFEGSIGLLDEALNQFDSSPLKIADYDLFYKGDLGKWKRLAKSLKLRVLMTIVDKDPSKAQEIGNIINAGSTTLVNSSADNFLVKYENVEKKKNPKFAIGEQYNGGQNFFFASKYVVDFMNSINDPRLPKFFDKPESQTNYNGIEPGEDGDDDVNPRIATSLHSATAPEVVFTYQEELFYEAEIYARGLGVAVDLTKANLLYKKAIEESAKFFGVPPSVATTFSTNLPTLLAEARPIDKIHYHHWVDKMDRGLDAFTQWRRSGSEGNEIPALTLPIGAPAGGLFRRFEYPITNEISLNPNAPKNVILLTEKTWFDL